MFPQNRQTFVEVSSEQCTAVPFAVFPYLNHSSFSEQLEIPNGMCCFCSETPAKTRQKTSFVGAKAWFVGVFQIFLGGKIWLIFFQMDFLKSFQLNKIFQIRHSHFNFKFHHPPCFFQCYIIKLDRVFWDSQKTLPLAKPFWLGCKITNMLARTTLLAPGVVIVENR